MATVVIGDALHACAPCLLADVNVCQVITARAKCAANQQKIWWTDPYRRYRETWNSLLN